MGIRFLCPNGHKLNVKEFLAGKRGICPQCDAKFLVPTASGGMAVADEGPAAVESGGDSTRDPKNANIALPPGPGNTSAAKLAAARSKRRNRAG